MQLLLRKVTGLLLIIFQLLQNAKLAHYKAKERIVSCFKGMLLLVPFIEVYKFLPYNAYMFYSAISTLRTKFIVHRTLFITVC